MYKYVLKRIFAMIFIVLGVLLVVQFIMYITPNDITPLILGSEWTPEAAAELRHELGIDQPLLVQYGRYILNLLQGDFGTSPLTGTPIIEQLKVRLPNTVILMLGGVFITVAFALPIGVQTAVKPNSVGSVFSTIFGLFGSSMPAFWLGLLLILLFSVKLGWLPAGGTDQGIKSLIMPWITLGLMSLAQTMRTTRSSMLESIRMDYIRTAKAKGVKHRDVIYKHALKNAMMPIITVVGNQVGILLGGAIITETVFAIPGMGRLMIEGMQNRDIPSTQGAIFSMAVCIAIVSLVIDLLYAYVDPRIKAQYTSGRRE